MTAFRVDSTDLHERAAGIVRTEPFGSLADEAALLPKPPDSSATASALDRLRHRLHAELTALSVEATSVGRATLDAAEDYRSTEERVTSLSGG